MEEKKREQLRKVPTRKLLASIKKDLKRNLRPVAAAAHKAKKS
jgi:hypothetical protein